MSQSNAMALAGAHGDERPAPPIRKLRLDREYHWSRMFLVGGGLVALTIMGVGPEYFWPSDAAPWEPHWRHNALRAAFVAAASIAPLFLFYLHALIRRESAFNAFASALDRLGLLGRLRTDGGSTHVESEALRKVRLRGYADRFAAAYGSSPTVVSDLLLQVIDDKRPSGAAPTALRDSGFQRRSLLAPAGVTLLSFLGWMIALPPLPHQGTPDDIIHILSPAMSPTVAAFLGAYLFSVEMLRRRFVLRDLNVNLYVSVMTRLIFSVALAAILVAPDGVVARFSASTVNDGITWLAFVIGAMPMIFIQILLLYVQKRWPRLQLSRGELPLRIMDGIDIWQEARLDEEDIQDIENLACANMVNLIVNTRYSADRLVDWVDQAILYTAIGPQPEDMPSKATSKPKTAAADAADPGSAGSADPTGLRALLRTYGIRTATDLVEILEIAHRHKAADGASIFPACVPAGVQARIRTLDVAIKNHPNFLLVRNWRLTRNQAAADEHHR